MAAFVTDTFTDTSNLGITSHTGETGATWAAVSGLSSTACRISNANRARGHTTGVSGAYASGSPASADYSVTATVRRITGAGEAGVLGRCSTSAATYYRATLSRIGADTLELYKFVAGSYTKLGGYAASLADSTNYTLVLDMVGTTIRVLLDGTQRISVTDSGISAAGKAGIYLYDGSDTTGYHIDTLSADDATSTLVSGSPTFSSSGLTTASVTCTAASGGTPTYTYQWQRSTSSGTGFSNVSGATSLTLNDTGLTRGTTYYYRCVATDSAAGTVNSSEVSGTTKTSQLVADGNSITYGSGATSWAVTIATYIGTTWAINNVAVSAQTTLDMLSDAAADVDALYSTANTFNVSVCQEGMNHIYFNGTAAAVCGAIESYCGQRKAKGFRVVVTTIPPRGDFAGTSTLPGANGAAQEAEYLVRRDAVNVWLRANWRRFADGLADIAADARIGDAGDEANATYYQGDEVHPTTTGQSVYAEKIAAAIAVALYQGGKPVAVRTRPRSLVRIR